MVDSFPKVQVVVVGIDRIVPDLESLDVMMALLPRSAVGAKMTAYFTIDQGPAHPGESDGPEEVHVVIMDNGRSSLVGTEFEDMLRCVPLRCVPEHLPGVPPHHRPWLRLHLSRAPWASCSRRQLEGYDNVGDLGDDLCLLAVRRLHRPLPRAHPAA